MQYAIETLVIEKHRLLSINRMHEVKVTLYDDDAITNLCKKNKERIEEIDQAILHLERKSIGINKKTTGRSILNRLIETVCYHLDLPEDEVFSKSKKDECVMARKYIYWIATELLGITNSKVAKFFGQDHATGNNAVQTLYDLRDTDEKVKKWMDFFQSLNLKEKFETLSTCR